MDLAYTSCNLANKGYVSLGKETISPVDSLTMPLCSVPQVVDGDEQDGEADEHAGDDD